MAKIDIQAGDNDGKGLSNYVNISEKYAALNKIVMRNLNNDTETITFGKYTKSQIQTYLSDPNKYEKQLREAVIYAYGASCHFRRLIQYFAGLTDLAYVVEPYKLDPKKLKPTTINNNYRKVINTISSMSIKTQVPKILTVCLREDVYYGTMWVTNDNITFQRLPSDYCKISTVEGNVPNVTFDFSYFDSRLALLDYYPQEFKTKYELYKKDRVNRWLELDAPTSFAVKCNNDILEYALPPFAGLLRELYDIEDYKTLKESKTALENYAMLSMKLPMSNEGDWQIDYDKAVEFWRNLDSVLPEEVGSVLTPMDINKIDFDKSNTGDTDTVSEAEQHLFSAAGVSSLLFNNEKASANALLLSIKADQSITYGIVKSVQDVINRFIQSQNYGKNFKVNFLDVSTYNRKEVGDAYLKAASYGLPTVSAYAASQGIGQAELDSMSYLETEVLNLQEMFKPLQSSAQMSSNSLESEEEKGAPQKDMSELSESREQAIERE